MNRSLLTHIVRLGATLSIFIGLITFIRAILVTMAMGNVLSGNLGISFTLDSHRGAGGLMYAVSLVPIIMGIVLWALSDKVARWIEVGTGIGDPSRFASKTPPERRPRTR